MKFTVVIPTYNRVSRVGRAIDSAKPLLAGGDGEIVVVDDGSTDATVAALQAGYAPELERGQIRLVRTDTNQGVTWAKNAGAYAARGQWIVFLDSDDRLVDDPLPTLNASCGQARAAAAPVVFFRCRSGDGRLIGTAPLQTQTIGVREYLCGWSWGECLPVVLAEEFRRYPYDADLRGFEGLAYARMMKSAGQGLVAGTVLREYEDTGDDRLSTPAGMGKRACFLARGHVRVLREFHRELGWRHCVLTVAKATSYALRCARRRVRQ